MDPRLEIDAVVAFDGRTSGTYAERQAARHLERRLTDLGREVRLEAIEAWPRWPQAYALQVLAAVAGSAASVSAPIVGTALVAAAVVLTFIDASMLVPTTRRGLGRRSSQNVVSEERGDKPGTLVLVAHYDTGRTGALFGASITQRLAGAGALVRRPVSAVHLLMTAMLAVLVCSALRILGVEGTALTAVQFVPTVALIAAVPLLLDAAVSPPSPGANDNASGVAMALGLAERHGGRLRHFDLWVLLTGSQEALAAGMRAFLARHRRELDRETTVFINLDEVGEGTVRYTRREGLLLPVRSHVQLVDVSEEIAEDDADVGAFDAKALVSRAPSDGFAARSAGYPAITVTCRTALGYVARHHTADDLPEGIDAAAIDRASGFCSELIERLDATVGAQLAR